MKKYIYTVLLGIAAIFGGCSDDEMELDKGHDVLTITAGREAARMDIRTPNDEAQVFNWTTGTNRGTGSAISYIFEMGVQGQNFAPGIRIDMGKRIYSKAYTVNEMNRALTEDLGLGYGQEATLEARVTAVVSNEAVEDQQSETVTFKATPFKPVTSTLYLLGNATPNGWNADEATPMNTITGTAGGFIWSGQLAAGELKFITTLGEFSPSYNRGADDNTLVLRENDEQPDDKFVIAEGGNYQIRVNLIDLTITISPLAGPRFSNIYFVGSFTGWGFEPMMQDNANPFLFRLGRVMDWNDGGEFKFGTLEGSWDNMLHPTIESAPYTHTGIIVGESLGDLKWELTQEQAGMAYKMVIDITEGAEKLTMQPFTPYEAIYMVGDASPAGWDVENATPMSPVADNPYLFTWTGNLTSGELKFSLDKQSDWGGAWFLAWENGLAPDGTEQQMVFSPNGDGGNDRKWNVTEAGSYTIELDQLREVVRITKN